MKEKEEGVWGGEAYSHEILPIKLGPQAPIPGSFYIYLFTNVLLL